MGRPAGLKAALTIACLVGVAAIHPAAAEEITVTVPLATPAKTSAKPAQPASAPRAAAAPVAAADSSSGGPMLPAFAGANKLTASGLNKNNAASPAAAAASAPAAKSAAPAVATATVQQAPATTGSIKHNQVAEDTGAAPSAAKAKPKAKAAATDTAAVSAAPADKKKTDAKKTKTAVVCKGLDETACGTSKGCKWSVPKAAADAKDATAKPAAPHCISTAAKKKPASTAKGEAEVLPWAKKTESSGAGEFTTKTTSETKSAAAGHKAKKAPAADAATAPAPPVAPPASSTGAQ